MTTWQKRLSEKSFLVLDMTMGVLSAHAVDLITYVDTFTNKLRRKLTLVSSG